jgi:hypothetical protein
LGLTPSPCLLSQSKKIIHATPAPQNNPITTDEFHRYVTPPHSSANNSIIIVGVNKMKPGISSLFPFCSLVARCESDCFESGICMKARIPPVIPPTGRFM